MFISLFDYLCLKDCHPPKLQWCWNESRLVKLLVFCLLSRKFGQPFFVGVSFVSFDKQAKFVSQQMRNCVCKTQTATTGTRPPLVASQYMKGIMLDVRARYLSAVYCALKKRQTITFSYVIDIRRICFTLIKYC